VQSLLHDLFSTRPNSRTKRCIEAADCIEIAGNRLLLKKLSGMCIFILLVYPTAQNTGITSLVSGND